MAAILFDEVHERNLTTDLGLALALDVAATLRPDLRVPGDVGHRRHRRLRPAARRRRRTGTGAGERRADAPRGDALAAAPTHRSPRTRRRQRRRGRLRDAPGDVLVFLPGIAEITPHRRPPHRVRPGRGRRPPARRRAAADEQDLALAPSPPGRRRVVLATDIAETSLTVEGVRVVVDGGLARAPRHDTGTGMTRLVTVAISRDSAEQRAGRAGRTEPGVCYRLWSRIEHGTRPGAPHRGDPRRRPRRTRPRAGGVGHAARSAALRRPAPAAAPGAPARRPAHVARGDRAGGRERRRASPTSGGRWSPPAAPAAGADRRRRPARRRRAWSPPSSTSATCCAAGPTRSRPTSPCAWRSCAGTRATTAPTGAPCARVRDRAADLARRVGCRFDLDSVDPDRTGCCCSPASRTGSPAAAATGSSSSAPAPGRGSPTTTRWRRRRSSSPPISTASGRARASVSARRSRRTRSPACSTTSTEHVRLEWDSDRDDLVVRVERRLDALPPRRGACARRTRAPRRRRRSSPGCARVEARRARLDAGRRAAARPRRPAAGDARRRVARPLRRRAAAHARRLAGTAPRRRHVDPPTSPASTWRRSCGAACRGQLGGDSTSWRRRAGPCRPAGPCRSTTPPTARPPRCGCRTCSASAMHPSVAGGRVPLTLALLSPADRPSR